MGYQSFETIDEGVPLPRKNLLQGRPVKYPFRDMKVGDSFFIPIERAIRSQTGTLYTSSDRQGIKISIRKLADGYRVWRVG